MSTALPAALATKDNSCCPEGHTPACVGEINTWFPRPIPQGLTSTHTRKHAPINTFANTHTEEKLANLLRNDSTKQE